MMNTKPLEKIGVLGTIYEFPEVGDELPVHTHDSEDKNHITIIALGSFEALGDEKWNGRILRAGVVIDWPLNKEHGFRALEKNSKLVNVRKNTEKRDSDVNT